MTRQNSNLTHHEALRYDYLHKNIHYLNEKERRELVYLGLKAEGELEARQSSPKSRPSRSDRMRQQEVYYSEAVEEVFDEEEDILPAYPRERKRRKKRPKRQKPVKQEIVEPVYRLDPEDVLPSYPRGKKVRKKKKRKGGFKRFIKFIFFLLLLVLAGMAFMFFKGFNSVETGMKARSEIFHGEKTRDGVNILVLGTDGRQGDAAEQTRTDSIMVVNINNKDKKIKMVSFMRDTLITIDGSDYKLNSTYTFGEQAGHQGAENVRQILKENFDLDIQHYVLVDFSTFATAIDTLFPEGVEIDAQFSTINGEQVSSVEAPNDIGFGDQSTPYQTIRVGKQRMNGQTLLNYARYRSDDEGDFGRTKRQQQVLSTIMSQSKNPTKLFTGSEALGKAFAMTSTSVPFSFLITNGVPTAFNSSKGVEQITVPEIGDWVEEYDIFGGVGLKIDFEKYKNRLAELGFR